MKDYTQSNDRYRREDSLVGLFRAWWSTPWVPKQPEDERGRITPRSVVAAVLAGVLAFPAAAGLYWPVELVASPTSAIATAWFFVALLLAMWLVGLPLADWLDGASRLREVRA